MRKPLSMMLAAAGVAAGLAAAPSVAADQPGCETIRWGFLGSQLRTICDGTLQADGSWMRGRMVWVPAHQVPFTCYYGTYYSSCSGGYFVGDTKVSEDLYPVTAATVLPDEPGYLGDATATSRRAV